MKIYVGGRFNDGCKVFVQTENGVYMLPPCNEIRNHSPEGFEWGYNGSGPAQLALAICFDHTQSRTLAEFLYQSFKRRFVSAIDDDVWELREPQLEAMIAQIRSALVLRGAKMEPEKTPFDEDLPDNLYGV